MAVLLRNHRPLYFFSLIGLLLLALDAGSTDPGPYYLGAGVPFVNLSGLSLELMLRRARDVACRAFDLLAENRRTNSCRSAIFSFSR